MPVQTIVVLALIALVFVVARRATKSWLKYHGARVVTCPESHAPAGVVVDAGHAAATALGHGPELRLSSCSRWPERAGCGQECLRQIEAAPGDCLVRNILTQWYEGKSCVSCGKPIGEILWADRKPALKTADNLTVDWSRIAAEEVPGVLATAQPVCFSCHLASTMVREHPGLVVDRSRPA